MTLLGVQPVCASTRGAGSVTKWLSCNLGRLQLARLDSAVLSFPSSPGLNSPGLLSAIAWGELKHPS